MPEETHHLFTTLGLSGSGKTCFMAGMYYKMSAGADGYTLKTGDDEALKLTSYYEKMRDRSGTERFPETTNQSSHYTFELQYMYKPIETFQWVDYTGGLLRNKNSGDAEEYQKLKTAIANSEVLYIFVDGGLFLEDDELVSASNDKEKTEILVDVIQESCARSINHFLSEYAAENQKLPPIAIVITKSDLAYQAIGKSNKTEAYHIICNAVKKAFTPLFSMPENMDSELGFSTVVGIIPVTLGKNISVNNNSGKLRPLNMHLPIYVGIYFMMQSYFQKNNAPLKQLAREIEKSNIQFFLNGRMDSFSKIAASYVNAYGEAAQYAQAEQLYLQGRYKEAYPMIVKCVDNGNPRATYILAMYYMDGYDVIPKDAEKKKEILKKFRYQSDDPLVMINYAFHCMPNSDEKTAVISQAVPDLERLAKQGDTLAEFELGDYAKSCIMNPSGHLAKEVFGSDLLNKKLRYYWEYLVKAAEKGFPDAEFSLGSSFAGTYFDENGNSATSPIAAAKWYARAVEHHYSVAEDKLEKLCGKYLERTKIAIAYYDKAIAENDPESMCQIGYCYKNGFGIIQNYAQAKKWFLQAANLGNSKAMYEMGELYYYGNSLQVDYKTAASWYQKAADCGEYRALYDLGFCYGNGKGVPYNTSESEKYYLRAASLVDAEFTVSYSAQNGTSVFLYGKIEKGCIKKDDQIEFQYGKKAYIQVKVISVKKSGIFSDKDIPIILKGITEKECVIVFKSITKYKDLSGVKVVVHRN